jgi:hypothetical protein
VHFLRKTVFLLGISIVFFSQMTLAQWRIHDIKLKPGWNAVQLEITPEPSECDKIFNGKDVESVWKWNKRFTTTEFDVDPNTLLPDDPHWLVWFPSNSPTAFLTKFHRMNAGGGYLIKMADNAQPCTLYIIGEAKIRNTEWAPHSLNLAGFPTDPDNPPTFADFFKFTPNIDTSKGQKNELFSINADGSSSRIVAVARDKVERNRGYWIKCSYIPKGSSVLYIPEESKLDFADYIDEQYLSLGNSSTTDSLRVSIEEIESQATPDGFPENAGMVPLAYYQYNSTNNFWSWTNLAANTPIVKTLAPGETWNLNFAVRRNNLLPYTPSGTNGYTYQSLLKITGDSPAGVYYVPVCATPIGSSNVVTETKAKNKGLWVGSARLYRVNCPAYYTSNTTVTVVSTNNENGAVYTNTYTASTNMLPTDSVLNMRLIVHVNADGETKLLREVFLATVPLDEDRTEARLYSDRNNLPADAVKISRISSVTLPFMPPIQLSGSFSNSLTGSVTVDCNSPVNPFLHKYNPLHDNRDWDYNQYTNAVETLTVSRLITFDFGQSSSSNTVNNPFWGSNLTGGVYHETIFGLRKRAIMVEGEFLLKRISLLDELY